MVGQQETEMENPMQGSTTIMVDLRAGEEALQDIEDTSAQHPNLTPPPPPPT